MGIIVKEDVIDSTCSQNNFAEMFNTFFKKTTLSSTYKPVFLLALTDIAKYGDEDLIGKQWIQRDGNTVILDLNFIAVRFIKYYWDSEIAFKMKHMPKFMGDSNNPDQDTLRVLKLINEKIAKRNQDTAIQTISEMKQDTLQEANDIVNKIQAELQVLTPPTLQELAESNMTEFRYDVIKSAIKPEVLVHLLTDMPNLYQRIPRQNQIQLDFSIIEFMKKYFHILRKALNFVLAKHLENLNPAARHIAIKIDSENKYESKMELIEKLEAKIDCEPIHILDEESSSIQIPNES